MSDSNFYSLKPDTVLNAIEQQGYLTTGEFYQLNSYENRVFDIVLEPTDKDPRPHIICKFYRPNRWSQDAINEEHEFLNELTNNDIQVIDACQFSDGSSIKCEENIYWSLFPKKLGRLPQEFIGNDLTVIGRQIAQLHNVGQKKQFTHRPTLGSEDHPGWRALDTLNGWVLDELWTRYQEAAETILDDLDEKLPEVQFGRIHGDLHRGNILSDDSSFFFVDFDDSVNGPAVQDFWMLLSGDDTAQAELDLLLKGYEELRHFDDNELELINGLRGLRILSYAAWIAARWQDPFFKKVFPQFNSYNYWAEEVESLERIAWSL